MMTKLKKLRIFVDYATNPIILAVTPSINIIGDNVYTYDKAFNTYSDSNLLKTNGKIITHSVMYQDTINKTLTGQSNDNIRYINRNRDVIDIYKSERIVFGYVDNNTGSFPINLTFKRVENIAVEQIFINGGRVYTVWDDITYNPSKKRYTVRYEERDKN